MENIDVEYYITSTSTVEIIYRKTTNINKAIIKTKQLKQLYEDHTFKIVKVITIKQDIYKI